MHTPSKTELLTLLAEQKNKIQSLPKDVYVQNSSIFNRWKVWDFNKFIRPPSFRSDSTPNERTQQAQRGLGPENEDTKNLCAAIIKEAPNFSQAKAAIYTAFAALDKKLNIETTQLQGQFAIDENLIESKIDGAKTKHEFKLFGNELFVSEINFRLAANITYCLVGQLNNSLTHILQAAPQLENDDIEKLYQYYQKLDESLLILTDKIRQYEQLKPTYKELIRTKKTLFEGEFNAALAEIASYVSYLKQHAKFEPHYQTASDAAQTLYDALNDNAEKYFKGNLTRNEFTKHCDNALNDAKQSLDGYYGWRALLAKIGFVLVSIATLGAAPLLSKALTGRFCFFNAPETQDILNPLTENVSPLLEAPS